MKPSDIAGAGWRLRALDSADAPALQRFLDANPLYSEIVNGRPWQPDEALQEITEAPPYAHRALHGLAVVETGSGRWLGFVSLVEDLIAPGVLHIGLFLIASSAHGSGLATAVYAALERWARASGARWMRLGVVVGNARAERFWARCGFEEIRQRHGMPYEGPSKSVRVMLKTLDGSPRVDYLQAVERDRPDSP
jgi:RimJ/RimL family protein N-acetyltransferase